MPHKSTKMPSPKSIERASSFAIQDVAQSENNIIRLDTIAKFQNRDKISEIDTFVINSISNLILDYKTAWRFEHTFFLREKSKSLLETLKDSSMDIGLDLMNEFRDDVQRLLISSDGQSADLVRGYINSTLREAMLILTNQERSEASEEERVRSLLGSLTWMEHFKQHFPPKYAGVSRSGKALPFFLRWYRAKNLDMTPRDDGSLLDYVELGMTQADLRKYDLKLLRALISSATYGGEFSLDHVIPPSFSKKSLTKIDI